jgi:hypothetical protein
MEPDPYWRECIIRAIIDLGVSVDGKGHFYFSVLKNVMEQDASPTVRKAAEKAIKKMETFRDGWEEGDHRRRLKLAFWWIRLAHVKSLNGPLNIETAKKTRAMEYKHSPESEHDEEMPDF